MFSAEYYEIILSVKKKKIAGFKTKLFISVWVCYCEFNAFFLHANVFVKIL